MKNKAPPLPRRVFLAVGLGTAAASLIAAMGFFGAVSAPMTESFRFTRGIDFASGEDARLRGFLAAAARDNHLVVIITGHTGTQGDATANQALSNERAEAASKLAIEMGVAPENIRAAGAGGGAPFQKPEDSTDRAYQSSLARVDVTVQVRR